MMQALSSTATSGEGVAALSTNDGDDDDGFFCFYEIDEANNSVYAELDMYINVREINSLHRFPLVKKACIEKNTSLPSSAPVECLFSIGGQILTPHRNGLTDDHFETLLLTRANRQLLKK